MLRGGSPWAREVRGITTPPISLGIHDLKPGQHRVTAEIVGANPKAVKAYMFALDYVALIPAAEEK